MNDYNPKEKYRNPLEIEDSAEKQPPILGDPRELYKKETTPRAS